jgi:hypothetical protein
VKPETKYYMFGSLRTSFRCRIHRTSHWGLKDFHKCIGWKDPDESILYTAVFTDRAGSRKLFENTAQTISQPFRCLDYETYALISGSEFYFTHMT